MARLLSRSDSEAKADGLLNQRPPLTLRGVDLIKGDCCGDSVLGWMLWKAGIRISGFFPLFNTYAAHKIPFTERAWCQPLITLHKSTAEDMMDLWRWEFQARQLGVSGSGRALCGASVN